MSPYGQAILFAPDCCGLARNHYFAAALRVGRSLADGMAADRPTSGLGGKNMKNR
jgi:hypothetical protein